MPVFFAVMIPVLLCLYYSFQYPVIAFITRRFVLFNKKFIYLFPFIFVTVDFLFPKLFRHSIADSQINFFYFIQLIDITGMSGLILIIMFFNLGLFLLLNKFRLKETIKIVDFIFILPFLISILYGAVRINELEVKKKSADTVFAAMIQGNISGKQKLDGKYFERNIKNYNTLTAEAVKKYSPDFLIWPESVFNRAYDGSGESLKRFILDEYPPLLVGITLWKRERNDSLKITNSCILVEKQKDIARYDKQRLLVFGEYIPFERTLPFLRYITPLHYSLTPGKTSSIFKINNKIRASLSICFEDIFPDDIRAKVNEGSNLMINITNDSWYGSGMGPLHHSVLARLRAIENRRSFYRCTPTGVTTASDFTGKIIASGGMWREEIIAVKLPLFDERSVYSYIGEIFSYLSIAAVLFFILFCVFKKIIWKK